MTWEQHKYAVERARDYRRKVADEINEASQMVTLQGEANGSDAELLDDVAEFLQSLEGSRASDEPGPAFIADWNRMIGTISNMCGKYNLPKPVIVFHPKWNYQMRVISQSPISDTIIYADVKIRFGRFEQADVLRS